MTYYNSLQGAENLFLSVLLNEVRSALSGCDIRLTNANLNPWGRCLIQPDGTSCGSYLIENIYCDLAQKQWGANQNFPVIFREKHLSVLTSQNDPHAQLFAQSIGREHILTAQPSSRLPVL